MLALLIFLLIGGTAYLGMVSSTPNNQPADEAIWIALFIAVVLAAIFEGIAQREQ